MTKMAILFLGLITTANSFGADCVIYTLKPESDRPFF